MSLDIELQEEIENFLSSQDTETPRPAGIGTAILDVATGDILALVSVPVYDLNLVRQNYELYAVRQNYEDILYAPSAPMTNKALYKLYPPGSVIKPFILIAGLEEKKINTTQIIPCPYQVNENGPDCWLFKLGGCHDWKWQNEGGNIARNAVKGSCNIYFSRLADRLEPAGLQKWLFSFGFGRKILPGPDFAEQLDQFDRTGGTDRNLIQSAGSISTLTGEPSKTITQFDELPGLAKWERKLFGIGQGNFSVTVLQVANAMAAIARDGIYKKPRFFLSESDFFNDSQNNLGISEGTLATVRDGMRAVVNESGGTAYSAFDHSDLAQRDMKIYGKTGSTQGSVNAWFAGFATDRSGRTVSIALIVEGGKSGQKDAAPLAQEILRLCNQAGYIGRKPN